MGRIVTLDCALPVATEEMMSSIYLLQPRSTKSAICVYMGKHYINPSWSILASGLVEGEDD